MAGLKSRLAVSAAAVLGLFVIGEVGYRTYLFRFASESERARYARYWDVPPELHKFRGHHYYNFVANEGYRTEDGLNRHNSLGFRGAEITLEKPAGTYRIVCIGGSTTYTNSVRDYRNSYPDQLERVLREEYGHDSVQVVNAGVGAWSSWESLIGLMFRVLPLSPDLLVVYHGTNDVHPRLVPPELYRRDNSGLSRQWDTSSHWWEGSVLLRWIGVRKGWARKNSVGGRAKLDYEDLDYEACLDANPPVYFEQNLETMVVLARHEGVAIMLATWAWSDQLDDYAATPHYQRGFRENNEVVLAVAEANGVPVFDFAGAMTKEAAVWSDGRHVNEEGARMKAEMFAAFIDEHFLSGD